MSDLLEELKKQTNTVSIIIPEENNKEMEQETEDEDFDIPLEGEEPLEDEKHAFDELFEDVEEAADLFIHVADIANQKVSDFSAQWAFFDANDKKIMNDIIHKKTKNRNFSEVDFTPEEQKYSNKYLKYQELVEGVAFSEKTKKALRKPVMKQIEKFKLLKFTPGQAILVIIGMNNIPLLMDIVPRAFGKLKQIVSNNGTESK